MLRVLRFSLIASCGCPDYSYFVLLLQDGPESCGKSTLVLFVLPISFTALLLSACA
jgi:hypothetical protein